MYLPIITGVLGDIPVNNTSIEVQFNEPIFSKNDGTGGIEKEDFALTITNGTAKLASATPSGIASTGSNKYRLTFAVTGRADGTEDLAVTPVANSIFDKAGNAAATTQSNNSKKLNDGRLVSVKDHQVYSSTSGASKTLKIGHTQYLTYGRVGGSTGRLYRRSITDDGSGFTDGFLLTGDVPTFRIYDNSENIY